MKTVLKTIFSVALFAGLVSAQAPPPPGPPPPGGPHEHGAFGRGEFMFGMHPGKVVTGAPYTATATDTISQTLADGNKIQRTITATVARDNSGRTYEQRTVTGGPFAAGGGPTTLTFISDPVAGYSYVLNATTKVATRRALHTPLAGSDGAATHVRPARPNVQETTLTPTTMNGVSVTGKTITHTIPAGEIGNAQPIVSTDTVWFSPELQVVVSATRNDPRTGSSAYALTEIKRVEPAASLFTVPSDYKLEDAKAFVRGMLPPQPPQQ